jgi:hypothetical protein
MTASNRLIERIRAEYDAVPGLKLTRVQAARLWSAPESDCVEAFDKLVAEGLLWLAPSGRYVALPMPAPASVQATSSSTRCPHCQKRNTFQRDETIHGRDVSITLRCVACQRVFTFTTIAA